MFNTKCGCPGCKGETTSFTRGAWKSRKNHHGNYYGSYKNPKAKHHSKRHRHMH